MIEITPTIAIDENELEFSFMRAGGPGGQNVNKVETAVQLRFNLRHAPSLPDYLKTKAQTLAGRRLTKDGIIVITANQYRTQERNKEDATTRLVELLIEAAKRPTYRRPTRPSRNARTKRTDSKTKRGAVKKLRKVRIDD